MANHLTPDEMANAIGMRTDRLVRYCVEQSIPIYHGRVDKTLVITSLLATGHRFPDDTDAEEMLAA
ncbi:MAG: hypothetical protein ACKORG_02295 [Actinomycetota bacterium]|jgi:hypothetical protein